MASIQEALAFAALADNPTANVVPSGWVSVTPPPFLPSVDHGLNYVVYINTSTSTKQIVIAFGSEIDPDVGSSAYQYTLGLIDKAILQTPVPPGTLALMGDAANIATSIFQTTQPGYSGLPIVTINGNNVGAGYTVFLTGAGIGGAAAEYAMEQVLSQYPVAQTNDLISGMSFGGPGLSNATTFQSGVDFKSYVLQSDLLGSSPLVPNHVGTTIPLGPTNQDYTTDVVVPGLAAAILPGIPEAMIASKVFKKVAETFIKGSDVIDYANALFQQGVIQSNPLSSLAPLSSLFNFNLQSIFSNITNYVQTLSSLSNSIDTQFGTIVVDGITQVISLTDFSDGSANLTVSDDPVNVLGSETTSFGSSGDVLLNQIVVDSATITTSGSESDALANSTDGSLIVIFSPNNRALGDFELIANPDGSSVLVGVNQQTSDAQEVASFSSGGLTNDVLNVDENSAGTIYSNLSIQNDATAAVNADSDLTNIIQSFSFVGSNGLLELDSPGSYTVYSALTGDFIELVGVTAAQILQFASKGQPAFIIEEGTQTTTISLPDYTGGPWDVGNILKNGNLVIEIERDSVPAPPDQTIAAGQSVTGATITETLTVVGTIDGNVTFDVGSVLELSPTASFSGAILEDFSVGDTIFLEGVTNSSLSFNTATGILTVGDPITLQFGGIPSGDTFLSAVETVSGSPSVEITVETDMSETIINGYTLGANEILIVPSTEDIEGLVVPFGFAEISDFGTLSDPIIDPNIVNPEVNLTVEVGGIVIGGTMIYSDGLIETIYGTQSSVQLGAGVTAELEVDGVETADTVSNGADLSVRGYASNISVLGGGELSNNDGTVVGASLGPNANLYILYGGTDTNDHIALGGNVEIYGGVDINPTIQGRVIVDTYSSYVGTLDGGLIGSTGFVDAQSGADLSGTINLSSGGELVLDHGAINDAFIDFGVGGTLAYSGITGATLSFNSATDLLTLDSNGIIVTDTLVGSYTGETFSVGTAEVNGILSTEIGLTENAECFLAGTRIMTPRGGVAVENLEVGDKILTATGETEKIEWIGQRSYDARFASKNHLVRPVCIKKNAIAVGVPKRNLNVSPGHGIFIDDVLVPAWRLINGKTITQAESAGEEIRYYHVELASHAVILAENCPAETYLDIGTRNQFQNVTSYTDNEASSTPLPRIESGFALASIKARLNARAGIATRAENPVNKMIGYVDNAGPDSVYGWALCPADPETPVSLDVYFWLGGTLNKQVVLANTYRADLRHAGLGSGCHAFEVELPAGAIGVRVLRTVDKTAPALTEAAAESPMAA